jgi:hypothetical protein
MTQHRIPRADLDESLRAIVRGGEAIDAITLDGEEYVVTTTDRIETRPTHAHRLGAA